MKAKHGIARQHTKDLDSLVQVCEVPCTEPKHVDALNYMPFPGPSYVTRVRSLEGAHCGKKAVIWQRPAHATPDSALIRDR